ncbi:shikimate dehydrogenase [Agromyces terreus]|uniref:Shikimate dehydrogenase n=1 Tax=Agromyces terreus TaxID=424795 RepID=A0A9X2H8Q6_9MICO|nr:shikimate dehydrogenase [Agromyces terreus]MCP2372094.1 shikimate dehydrogenase [Agromyces terreus]
MAEPIGAAPARRLAVLGRPIGHSKSPGLHLAAYRRLGLDWSYERVDMDGAGVGEFVRTRGPEWRGLSLTMPLKHDVLPALDEIDAVARLTGAANTVLLDGGRRLGFNTDVGGIVRSLADAGLDSAHAAVILGGGATAASALAAVAQLGVARVRLLLRRPEAGGPLVELGRALGVVVEPEHLAALAEAEPVDLVVSTLPGGTDPGVEASAALASAALLLDVAYAPWPTVLAGQWIDRDGRVIDGSGMLLHQALLQVRIFVGGDPTAALPDEQGVLDVMRESLR